MPAYTIIPTHRWNSGGVMSVHERGVWGPALARRNPRRSLERLPNLWVRREIRLRELEQNPATSRPIVCALADALHDVVREELVEALDWGLDVLEVDPFRST